MIRIIFSFLFLGFSSTFLMAQTEPENQATNISFLGVKAYGMSVSFTGSDAEKYLILRSTSTIVDAPIDGNDYKIGEWIGNAKVLANASNSFYSFRESVANTEYHFAIYAYNDGASPNYLTTNPLKGSEFTLGSTPGNFYDDYRIDTENAITDLTDLLKSHVHLDYGDYDDVVENIHERDTVISNQSRKYVVCEYSDLIYDYSENAFSFSTYNREHVTAKSWMPTTPDSDDYEGSDYYNLFLVEAVVNQNMRSALKFSEVDVSESPWINGSCMKGVDINGFDAFEPKESIKGDVARTLFYQLVTYDGTSGSWSFDNLLSNGHFQDVALLVNWHLQDPVDNFEIARNEYIYSKQGNRNPFVDFPEWSSCVDFKTLTLNGTCPLDTAGIDSTIAIQSVFNDDGLNIYPNPINDKGFLKLNSDTEIFKIELYNATGHLTESVFDIEKNIATFNLENLSNGIYFLRVYTDKNIYNNIIMIE